MKGGTVLLSEKEARRVYVMDQLLKGVLTVREAAGLLGLSERQVKRLKGGMKKEGVAFLAHKNRGRKPKHALPEEVSALVVSLFQGEYHGASCPHLAELLAQHHGIIISPRTVHRILSRRGLLSRTRRKARRRRCRERMPQEGLLIQCDGSPFDWLEGRGPKLTLLGAIDDATGKILGLCFRPEEDTLGYFLLFSQVVQNHGVPYSVYSDRHSIFFSPKTDKLSIEEELAGKKVSLTQLGRALNELGVIHIRSRSPQGRGRIERLWNTLQSRLVVELRIAGITTCEEANAFLPDFIARYNARFAVAPADPQPAYRPAPPPHQLEQVLCFKEERKASRGSTISYYGCTYQLVDAKGSVVSLQPRSKITVLTHLDGSRSALYNGKRFFLQPFASLPKSASSTESSGNQQQVSSRRGAQKPAPDHPWRKPRQKRSRLVELDPVEAYYEDKQRRQFWKEVFAQR